MEHKETGHPPREQPAAKDDVLIDPLGHQPAAGGDRQRDQAEPGEVGQDVAQVEGADTQGLELRHGRTDLLWLWWTPHQLRHRLPWVQTFEEHLVGSLGDGHLHVKLLGHGEGSHSSVNALGHVLHGGQYLL